ncbi:MAG: hypothetical protein ACOYN0_14555, partial [Phycisphaerales bacterium]
MNLKMMLRAAIPTAIFVAGGPCAAQPAEPAPAAGAEPAAAVDLTLKAAVGDTFRYKWTESTWQRTAPIETPEGGQVREGTLEAEAAFTVKEAGASGWTMELVYERIKVSGKAGAREASYDSANPGPEPEPVDGKPMERAFESSIKPLIGHKVTVKLDKGGVVSEVSGAALLMDMTSPSARFALLLMSAESLSSKFGAAFTSWRPEEGGASWKSQQLVPYVPGILFDVAYAHEMKVLEGGLVEIAMTGTPVLKVPNPRRLGTREIKSSTITCTQRWNPIIGRGDWAENKQESTVLLKAP